MGRLTLEPVYLVLLLAEPHAGPFAVSLVMHSPDSQSGVISVPTDDWPEGAWVHRVITLLEPQVEYAGSALYTIAILVNGDPLVTLTVPVAEEGDYADPNSI